jgi:beta-phosphoglucomutase
MQLTQYFDAIADPAKVAASKPAPDIFIAAAQAVDAEVQETIGIEDAYSGIAAIKAANILPIGVGQSEILGTDIALVNDTNDLTVDFLIKVWENR